MGAGPYLIEMASLYLTSMRGILSWVLTAASVARKFGQAISIALGFLDDCNSRGSFTELVTSGHYCSEHAICGIPHYLGT